MRGVLPTLGPSYTSARVVVLIAVLERRTPKALGHDTSSFGSHRVRPGSIRVSRAAALSAAHVQQGRGSLCAYPVAGCLSRSEPPEDRQRLRLGSGRYGELGHLVLTIIQTGPEPV